MKTENGEDVIINTDEKKKIFDTLEIIQEFIPDIKMINSMLTDHAKRIDEEKEDREKDTNEIKTNYLKRFDDIKKDIRNSFWGISFYFLATIIGLILAKIFKLL